MWEIIINIAAPIIVRSVINIGVRVSKTTENTLDDLVFSVAKKYSSKIQKFIFRK